MKLTTLLIVIALVQASAKSFSQQITLHETNAPLTRVINAIKQQSGYQFLYTENDLKNEKLTVQVNNANIDEALKACFGNTQIDYKIVGKSILLKKNQASLIDQAKAFFAQLTVTGKVLDETGQPMFGVTVKIKGTNQATSTDKNGVYTITVPDDQTILVFSFIGYESFELAAKDIQSGGTITLKPSQTKLNEVIVNKGYYTTTEELNTGSVSRVTSAEIDRQPVTNPIGALAGRVPGLFITQESGLPGGGYTVQLRGQNSIFSGNAPLYVIDCVPFNSTTLDIMNLGPISTVSPLSSINPKDIESIEVLKDADATAIYGSRGGNGVILITTKKGKAGKTIAEANVSSGYGQVTRMVPMMNTQQYIAMRKEAFKNDGLTPSANPLDAGYAPDLTIWDTNRYTDWQKLMIGGKARYTDVQTNISGGSQQTQFFIGGNYHYDSTVFPGGGNDRRGGLHFNLNHDSANGRFKLALSGIFNHDDNNIIGADLTNFVYSDGTIPNAPAPFDSNGNLIWSDQGISWSNPFAYLKRKYLATNNNLVSNLTLRYQITDGLSISSSNGYSLTNLKQFNSNPLAAQDPASSPISSARFGNNGVDNYIIEPKIEYNKTFGFHQLSALAGSTFSQQITDGTVINASNFSTDALIESPTAASSITSQRTYYQYRYESFYGRLNYDYEHKYLLNLVARRDGSSRFGPGRKYANFGSIGAAWIFSKENFIATLMPFLSYGKLHASYGSSGNDQIGDYQYLDSWRASSNPYGGSSGLLPNKLFNENFSWEVNKKFEIAADLGFLHDRILLSVNYFKNRSGNQLIPYTLPTQTGFGNINKNFSAVVQNTGWEFDLHTQNIKGIFSWETSFNLTISRNKLVEFPGLNTSSYYNTYVIGQPVSIIKQFHFNGIDPQTGYMVFSGTNSVTDKTQLADYTPKFYGGFSNHLTYKRIDLDFLIQFVKKKAPNFVAQSIGYYDPGTVSNQPTAMLIRWQSKGDNSPYPLYSTWNGPNSGLLSQWFNYVQSDAIVSDASYLRLKNISLGYQLPDNWSKHLGLSSLKVYAQAQNLVTITNYFGLDPEVPSSTLPPLNVITFGIKAGL